MPLSPSLRRVCSPGKLGSVFAGECQKMWMKWPALFPGSLADAGGGMRLVVIHYGSIGWLVSFSVLVFVNCDVCL